MKIRNAYSMWFLLPAMAVFLLFFMLPNILNLFFGFTDWSVYNITTLHWIGLENFRDMLKEPLMLLSIKNTFIFTFATTILSNIIGFFLALALDSKIRLRGLFRNVFFIPTTLSVMVVAPIFSALYDPNHGPINVALRAIGLNSLAVPWITDPAYAMIGIVVMSLWSGIGITMLLYLTGMQSLSKEYFEAGIIDGCNFWQKATRITIPLIMPAVTVNLVLSLINGLKVFGQVYALTNGGPNNATQVFGTFIFQNFSKGLYGYSAAISFAFTLGHLYKHSVTKSAVDIIMEATAGRVKQDEAA